MADPAEAYLRGLETQPIEHLREIVRLYRKDGCRLLVTAQAFDDDAVDAWLRDCDEKIVTSIEAEIARRTN